MTEGVKRRPLFEFAYVVSQETPICRAVWGLKKAAKCRVVKAVEKSRCILFVLLVA